MKRLKLSLSAFFILFFGCVGPMAISPTLADQPSSARGTEPTGVIQALIDLLDHQDRTKIDPNDYQSTSLKSIITLGTPAGYRLKLRYLNFGMSLVEALKIARDDELKRRLIEMVQWTREPRVRAEAILTLAGLSNPEHKKYLKSALLDSKVGIRFAALEALQGWGQPDSVPLLELARTRDWSPFNQIFAAQALLSLGHEEAISTLWAGLDNNSWVIRAMAARYLGDYADPNDYTKLISQLNRETKNDYVVAELSIASLKLISKKGDKTSYSPASKSWRDNDEVRYTIGKGGVVELEPLVIVPPRLRIPQSLQVASKINNELLRLIRERMDGQLDPEQANDPILQELNSLLTPSGFALQTRYSQLNYLIVEGLAGTNDLRIQSELEKMARESPNPLVRAASVISLSYTRDAKYIFLIQDALRDKNAIVRFGAMEAIEVGRYKDALPSLSSLVGLDNSEALQVYAIQILAKFGDASARYQFLSAINSQDWPTRAMAFWYLGRYSEPADYTLVLSRLGSEQNPFVKAEICLAALRLAPL
jgi:HEAT repeat protein